MRTYKFSDSNGNRFAINAMSLQLAKIEARKKSVAKVIYFDSES